MFTIKTGRITIFLLLLDLSIAKKHVETLIDPKCFLYVIKYVPKNSKDFMSESNRDVSKSVASRFNFAPQYIPVYHSQPMYSDHYYLKFVSRAAFMFVYLFSIFIYFLSRR